MSTTVDMSKSTMTNLFHKSVQYHRRRLRELYRAHYDPFKTDAVWTSELPERVINNLRLHLSWDLGLRVFDWSRESIGTHILYRFKELGILLFLNNVIMIDRTR